MKVFICKMVEDYQGGLAVVAANTKEEAFETFFSDRDTVWWLLDRIDRETGQYTDDVTRCDSKFYPRADWQEIPILEADTIVPRIIAESHHIE